MKNAFSFISNFQFARPPQKRILSKLFSFCYSILVLTFIIFLLPVFCLSESNSAPRLIFKKQIKLTQKENAYAYKIKKGEYIYSLLRSHQVKKSHFAKALMQIRKLNPQIKDLNKVHPGEVIYLPEKLKKQNKWQAKSKKQSNTTRTIEYIVKPGDYLGAILLKAAYIPDKETFKKLLLMTKRLNPQIKNLNQLQVGENLTIPLPISTQNKYSAKETKAVQTEKEAKELSIIEVNQALVLSVLNSMGFEAASGHSLLFPREEQGWFEIELHNTPIFKTPWMDSIILVPQNYAKTKFLNQVREKGFLICSIDPNWKPAQVFADLEKTLKGHFIFWEQFKPLILSLKNTNLEISSKFVFMLRYNGMKSFYLFNESAKNPISKALIGYLHSNNLNCYELIKQKTDKIQVNRLPPPNGENFFIPTMSRQNVLELLSINANTQFFHSKTLLKKSVNIYLQDLQNKGLLSKHFFTLNCSLGDNPKSFLKINFKLVSLEHNHKSTILLPPDRNSTFLVALLSLKGYNCYVLK